MTEHQLSHVPGKPVVVCVDDFGLSVGINQAVAQLADAQVISAVACMPLAPAWRTGLALLTPQRCERLDIGLHFNLTEPTSCTNAVPLPALIIRSYLRLGSRRALRAEVQRQLDAFEDGLGKPPDFVDGHQHVHQLPQVRDAVIDELCRRYSGAERPYVRSTVCPSEPTLPDRRKAQIIQALGARAHRRALVSTGLRHNARLLGVYGFAASPGLFAQHLEIWAGLAQAWDLFMVHPSLAETPQEVGPLVSDGIRAARLLEFEVLSHSAASIYARHALIPSRLSSKPNASAKAA